MPDTKKKSNKKKCERCKSVIPRREYLKCVNCQQTLDLVCARAHPFVRFNIMDAERKKIWRCDKCLVKNKHSLTPTVNNNLASKPTLKNNTISHDIHNESGNINTRQRHKLRASSVELLDINNTVEDSMNENISTFLEDTRMSLPDLNANIMENKELQEQVKLLKTQLESAHLEIERLNTQVTHLQKNIDDHQRKSQVLKQLLTERTIRKTTPLKTNRLLSPRTHGYRNKLTQLDLSQDVSPQPMPATAIDNTEKVLESPISTLNDTQESDSFIKSNNINKIYIFGSQQCVGLGSRLHHSRLESNSEKYSICALIKPNATAEEILKECSSVEDSPKNYLIICAGEHDSNPTKVFMELASVLRRFHYINIIVLGVIENQNLNTYKLNNTIANMCNNTNNCTFVDINNKNRLYLNNNKILYLTCEKINFIINFNDYSSKYLSSKGLRKIIKMNRSKSQKSKNSKQLPRKGTIPYYFPVINMKSSSPTHFSQEPIDFLSTTSHLSQKT